MSDAVRNELRLDGPLPDSGHTVVEASAGTGKTYSLTALIVRAIAEGQILTSKLLVVTFTRAAAAELRDRTHRALRLARDVLSGAIESPDDEWITPLLAGNDPMRNERLLRVEEALNSFDEATISTIHGFCQQALRQLGFRSGAPLDGQIVESTSLLVDEICRDLLVRELSPAGKALSLSWSTRSGPVSPSTVLTKLKEAVNARLNNPKADVEPVVTDTDGKPVGGVDERLRRWVQLVDEAVKKVRERRILRNEMGYDDLVQRLGDAVCESEPPNPVGAAERKAARETLRKHYRMVLVDEFQDTDAVQWDIFKQVFEADSRVITVGDPKQAIYRFRGADIHAYLEMTDQAEKKELFTNFRSDADLVAATGYLLNGVELGHQKIVVQPVNSRPSAPSGVLGGAPLEIRWLPRTESVMGGAPASTVLKKCGWPRHDGQRANVLVGSPIPAAASNRAILEDVAAVVVDLLENGYLNLAAATGTDGEQATGNESDATGTRVRPSDIAILVPSHSKAEAIVAELARVRVPAVRTRTGSVFNTEAAQQWRRFLAALERPSAAPVVRAAAIDVFLQVAPVDLDPDSESGADTVATVQQRCARWAELLTGRTVLSWYDHVRASSGLVEHVLGQLSGERDLTDLDHIAELLAEELPGTGHSAAVLRRRLEQLIASADDGETAENQIRRIDSDAEAVQVTTLHASKGLEFPIVLLPFSSNRPTKNPVLVYNSLTDPSQRILDVATGQSWQGPDIPNPNGTIAKPDAPNSENGRKLRAAVERQGDELRLLYVGLTRGKHRTIVWWAAGTHSTKSALSRVLFDRDSTGAPRNTAPHPWDGSVAKSNLDTGIHECRPTDAEVTQMLNTLVARSSGLIGVNTIAPRTQCEPWTGQALGIGTEPLATADPAGCTPRDPAWRRWSFTGITRSLDEPWSPYVPAAGGLDEPLTGGDGPLGSAMSLADVVGGVAFGRLVHQVLEHIDTSVDDLEAEMEREVVRQLRRHRLPVDAAVLVRGLLDAMRTPLGPIAEHRVLESISPSDRLSELDFDLPIADTRAHIGASEIGTVLLDTLRPDDPLREYAQMLADSRFDLDLAGYLQGSVDAVLRVHDAQGTPRFLVVDYKTNVLHRRGGLDIIEEYHPDKLVGAMTHSDYPLQALLYSVALHRFLRWRMPEYDPEVHLGGIAYLFVRGMIGPATPTADGRPYGVFAWRPPAATIAALEALFAGERVA